MVCSALLLASRPCLTFTNHFPALRTRFHYFGGAFLAVDFLRLDFLATQSAMVNHFSHGLSPVLTFSHKLQSSLNKRKQ